MNKRFVKVSFLILFILILFRGQFFRLFVKYEKIKERTITTKIDENLKTTIRDEIKNMEQLDLKKIIQISSEMTSSLLHFSFENHPQDLSNLINTGKANCIGYARLFCNISEFILQEKKLYNQFEIKHVVGKIYFLGWDTHHFFDSDFFKDHDYVSIYDKIENETIFIDPSLLDYFRIASVRGN